MNLRHHLDTVSRATPSAEFVATVVAGSDDAARLKLLTEFCQAMFDVMPEKTKAKIAGAFGWEPVDEQ